MGFVSCALKGFEKEKIEGLIGYGFQKEKRKRKKEKRNNKECFFFLCFFFILQRKMKHKKCFFFLFSFSFFLFETHILSNLSIFSFSNPFNTKNTKPISSLTHLQIQVSIFVSFFFSLSYQCLSLRSVVISSGRFQWWVVIFVDLGLWVCGKFDCVFP